MNRATALTLALALIAGLVGLFAGRHMVSDRADDIAPTPPLAALVGTTAAPVSLPALDGTVRSLEEWRGRPLLVNFWASWCAPCIEEMPLLERFAASQGADGVQVLGIALDERDAILAFLRHTPVSYPLLLDTPSASDSSVQLGNLRGVLPYSVLLGADGRIRAQKLGPFRDDQLERWLQSLH